MDRILESSQVRLILVFIEIGNSPNGFTDVRNFWYTHVCNSDVHEVTRCKIDLNSSQIFVSIQSIPYEVSSLKKEC